MSEIQVNYDPFAEGELAAASPSTAPQKELWVASQVGGPDANRAFNESLYLNFEGTIDAEVLRFALEALVARHETLRGKFSADGDYFIVSPHEPLHFEQHDFSQLSEAEQASAFSNLTNQAVDKAFDLLNGPLYRVSFVKFHEHHSRLLFTAHHIACDGWSVGVLMLELGEFYRAQIELGDASKAALQPVSSFTKYAFAQKAREGEPQGAEDVAYWLNHLRGKLSPINLPTDRPRPHGRSYAAARLDIPLETQTLAALRELGRKTGSSTLVAFMGVVQSWLVKVTQQSDLIIGVPSAGQAASGEASLVGHCVHLLPIRSRVDVAMSLASHIKAAKADILNAFDHQQITFSSILGQLDVPKDQSGIPLVPLCVNIDTALSGLNFGGATVGYETVARKFETFDLFINAVDYRDRLVLECSYNTHHFDASTIRRWVRQMGMLIDASAQDPSLPIEKVSLLDDEDRRLIRELNATQTARRGLPVDQLVGEWARSSPDAPAVIFEDVTLTYGALERKACQLAALLVELGIEPGATVGVSLSRSEQMVVALLAVMKTGAAYVPMDPSYPLARTTIMAEDGNVQVLLTDSRLRNQVPPVDKRCLLDECWNSLEAYGAGLTDSRSLSTSRAYVLFTSGSTGRPKGVEIPHSAFENFLESMCTTLGFGVGHRQLALTTISFDIAGAELFCPLISGGTVILCSSERATNAGRLTELMETHHVDYMQATPATWVMLLESGWQGREDLAIGSAGEAFPPELAKPLVKRAGGGVWNLYGPTETTVYSSVKRLDANGDITIGRPLDNTQFYIFSERQVLVPVGTIGELWIGGAGVATGYIGRPDLTSERFLPDPFVPGQRMYKTGDLARLRADGEVECLGRTDFQVKIRGFRIELEEIEAALATYPGVTRCVVSVNEGASGDKRLVAYVTGVGEDGAVLASIRDHLRERIAPYMVPQHVVSLSEFPLTENGKIDRKELPAPQIGPSNSSEPEGPRTPVEETLCGIFAEVLGDGRVDIDSNFFDLGGSSLHSIRIVDRANKCSIRMTPQMIFLHPTVRQLAEATSQESADGEDLVPGSIVGLRPRGTLPPLFLVHSLPGDLLGYGHLVHCIGEDQPIYGFHGLGKVVSSTSNLEELAVDYAAKLQAFYPEGPVNLAGWCFGGSFALAIADALRVQGRTVGLVALLESWPSRSRAGERARGIKALVSGSIEKLPNRKDFLKRLLHGEPEEESGAFHLEIKSGPFAHRSEIYARNRRAAESYRSRHYPGEVILIRSSVPPPGSLREHDYGWSEFLDNVKVFKVAAPHEAVIRPPIVREVAEILRQELASGNR